MTTEKIDRCELCGLVDHHLVGDECARCRAIYGHDLIEPGEEDVAQDRGPEPLPMGDESDVTHVLTLMGAASAMEPA